MRDRASTGRKLQAFTQLGALLASAAGLISYDGLGVVGSGNRNLG